MKTLNKMIGLFVITAALASVSPALEIGQPAPLFDLKDQFGETWKLSEVKGRVVVLVASTKKSGELMGPWVDGLKNKYPNRKDTLRLYTLVDLHTIPGLFHNLAISRIKRETKDPVLIDFDGKTAKAYEASDNYPVVIVIGKDSVVREVKKTKMDKTAFDAVTSAIDKALQETQVSLQP